MLKLIDSYKVRRRPVPQTSKILSFCYMWQVAELRVEIVRAVRTQSRSCCYLLPNFQLSPELDPKSLPER
jgi:hypothetical protein